MSKLHHLMKVLSLCGITLSLFACAGAPVNNLGSKAVTGVNASETGADYQIGAGDTLQIFVWRNPDFSATVPVRPDGKISTPLVEDIVAVGKRPTQLAREIEQRLKRFIKSPVVTVIVTDFVGQPSRQVRVIGEAAEPQAIAYREGMTVLDVMIAVGGLTEFASGNRATIVRSARGKRHQLRVKLQDLLNDGDISANIEMKPGDILIVPRSWF